jgi:hypothetical protein
VAQPTKRKRKGTKGKKGSKKKKSIAEKVKEAETHVSDIGENLDYLKILVYGRNGRGKTKFGATGPKPIIIDCDERGTPSARRVKGAKKFRVTTWEDIDLAYWWLKAGNHDRETVVIDTVSGLASMAMKFVLGDLASRDPTLDPKLPIQKHWFKVTELMKTEIKKFRNLDMHVVFLAQERRDNFDDDDTDGMPEVIPALSRAAREELTASVNVIGRIYTREVVVENKKTGKSRPKTEFRLLLANHDIYQSKVNIEDHGLPRIMRNPTIPKMLDIINRNL